VLRESIGATADAGLAEIAARVKVTMKDGTVHTQVVDRVTGSAENPMSDTALEAKVSGLAQGVLSQSQVAKLIAQCWRLMESSDAAELARCATPA